MSDIAVGFLICLMLVLIFIEILLINFADSFDYKKLLRTKMTNLEYVDYKNLLAKIRKEFKFGSGDFKIVYAKSRIVIKIKDSYFEFNKKQNSLIYLFSENKMLEEQIKNIRVYLYR